jgi:hypothetical protein
VAELGVDALLLALESTFVPQSAGLSASYELRLSERRFAIGIAGESITIQRGSPRRPDAVIATDPATLRALVFDDLVCTPLRVGGGPSLSPADPGRAPRRAGRARESLLLRSAVGRIEAAPP